MNRSTQRYSDGHLYKLKIQLKHCRDTATVVLDRPEATVKCFEDLSRQPQETVCVACLDTRNQLIVRHTVFVGSTDMVFFNPREILRTALLAMATRIVVVHNHPSGIPDPSRDDLEVTAKLNEACETIGIELLDHVIIGREGQFWSWALAGKPGDE